MDNLRKQADMYDRTRRDSPTKQCTHDDCARPLRAKGLCAMHWKREYGKRTKYPVTCETCGVDYLSTRPAGRFCSDRCKGDQCRTRTYSPLPLNHPVRILMRPAVTEPRTGSCAWCGAEYATHRSRQVMCSPACKIKAKRCRRRGRAAGSISHYTWTEVMRLFLKFGRCCAYCEQPIVGQPDPDHVVPLSRGGSNSATNILPCCRLCNSDKRDLLLHEWAADRTRRGLPPVTTAWPSTDSRIQHLTDPVLIGGISPAA